MITSDVLGIDYPEPLDSAGDIPGYFEGVVTGVERSVMPAVNVKAYGAAGDGTTDDTAAIRAAIAAVPESGGTVVFPIGVYVITSTIDLGVRAGLRLAGSGRPGHSAGLGTSGAHLLYSGTGYCLTWATAAVSAVFYGVTIENLHIAGATTAPAGGIYLGNSAGCLIANVTLSDFHHAGTTGTGIRIGLDAGDSSGSQYNTVRDVQIAACDIGIDVHDSNGVRIIGGTIEGIMAAPPAGTVGVRFGLTGDTCSMLGTVVQGFDILVDIQSFNNSCIGVRCEAFNTAYKIGNHCNGIIGGTISNYINGSGGTGFSIQAGAVATLIMIPGVGSVATKLADAGTKTTAFFDPDDKSYIYSHIKDLKADTLTIDKTGTGAQNPALTMQSNGINGPAIHTLDSFATMVIDHAYASAAGMSLRVRGVEALALGDGNRLGFFGATPVAKPGATAELKAALAGLGLVTDGGAMPLDLDGGTLTAGAGSFSGDVAMNAHKITGLADPASAQDAATRAYVLAQIAALVNSAPSALDTLKKLADALGDDANYASTITTALAGKTATSRAVNADESTLSGGGNLTADRTLSIKDGGITPSKFAANAAWATPQSINAQTGTTYTLVLGDAGKLVTLSNASPITLTVDTNANAAFAVGTHIDLTQIGAGQVTVAAAGGVTVGSTPTLKLRAQYSVATLVKTGTDTWLLAGDLAAT